LKSCSTTWTFHLPKTITNKLPALNFPLLIARKYFWSKDKKNFINIISIISMLVVGMATMALVVILSVFNGLEDLLRSLYGSFDPDIKIEAKAGKSFVAADSLLALIEGRNQGRKR